MKALLPLSLLGNLFACIFALAYFNTMPLSFGGERLQLQQLAGY